MTYMEAAMQIEDFIKFHFIPDLMHGRPHKGPHGGFHPAPPPPDPSMRYTKEALKLAVIALKDQAAFGSQYSDVHAGTILYFVNEDSSVVEKCKVIQVQYDAGRMSTIIVKFESCKDSKEYGAYFLGRLFFLTEEDALNELDNRIEPPEEPEIPEEDENAPAFSINGEEYSSLADAIAAADDDTITVLKNTTITSKLTVSKKMSIDLNGKRIIGEGASAYLSVTGASGDLTIVDNTGGGEIYNTGEKWAIQVASNATLHLGYGAVIDSPNPTTAILLSSGNLCMTGGVVNNAVGQAIHAQSNSIVKIEGGTVKATGYAVKIQSGSSLKINGGKLTGEKGGVDAYGTGTVEIKDGTIESTSGTGLAIWDTVHLTVDGGNISGVAGIMTNGSANPSNQGVIIDINRGSIEGTTTGIYLPAGTLNINQDASIDGLAGIFVRGGTLNVANGRIRATGTDRIIAGDAGYSTPTAAIAIDRNENYNKGNVAVSISGGCIDAPETVNAVNFTSNGKEFVDSVDGIAVTGGYFSDASVREFVPNGYTIMKDRVTGRYVVGESV